MGLAKRLRKKYTRPIKIWDKERIKRDKDLMKRYALKNKREIWKMESLLRKIRERARGLIALRAMGKGEEESKQFIKRLYELGVLKNENAEIDDVLEISLEDILRRRLSSVLYYDLKLAKSVRDARQMIVHGHVYIGDRIILSPSYLVKRYEEKLIGINLSRESNIKNGESA